MNKAGGETSPHILAYETPPSRPPAWRRACRRIRDYWWNTFLPAPPGTRVAAEVALAAVVVTLVPSVAGIIIALVLAALAALLLAASERARRWRGITWCLLVVVLVQSVRVDQCPHARYMLLGPIPVVWSGRARANPRHYQNLLGWAVHLQFKPEGW